MIIKELSELEKYKQDTDTTTHLYEGIL